MAAAACSWVARALAIYCGRGQSCGRGHVARVMSHGAQISRQSPGYDPCAARKGGSGALH